MKNCKIPVFFLGSMIASGICSGTFAFGHANTLSHRVTATVGAGQRDAETFQLDFSDNDPTDRDTGLQITCIKGCQFHVKYSEQSSDSSGSITAFRVTQASPDLITIWGGGDGYSIRIYRVGHGKIKKVLDQGTRSWPQITVDDHNNLLVLLAPGIEANYPNPILLQLWAWTGERYQVRRTMGSAAFDIEYTRCETQATP